MRELGRRGHTVYAGMRAKTGRNAAAVDRIRVDFFRRGGLDDLLVPGSAL